MYDLIFEVIDSIPIVVVFLIIAFIIHGIYIRDDTLSGLTWTVRPYTIYMYYYNVHTLIIMKVHPHFYLQIYKYKLIIFMQSTIRLNDYAKLSHCEGNTSFREQTNTLR